MATMPTLADMAKRTDENGKVTSKIIELLTQTNQILLDMDWQEGNLPTGHKTTVRTGLPDVTWRMLNYGVQPSKSHTAQVTDTTGMLEAYAQIDKRLADLNGNKAEWRVGEDRAFLEAMNQEMARTLFYGDQRVFPAKFGGLSPRFDEITADESKSGSNIIDAGGTGANLTSIWFVTWGQNTVHGIYPKGSRAGFNRQDLGEVTLEDANGGLFQGYRTHYSWDCGLTVRDWRSVVRIANIDVNTLRGDAATTNLVELMIEAYYRLGDSINLGTPVIYLNKTLATALDIQSRKDANVHLSLQDWQGKKVLSFREMPIRRVDQIVNTEARVLAAE